MGTDTIFILQGKNKMVSVPVLFQEDEANDENSVGRESETHPAFFFFFRYPTTTAKLSQHPANDKIIG
jgi:hypothetical protein